MTTEVVMSGVVVVSGIVIWAVRQEGRINFVEKQYEVLMKRLDRLEDLLLEALGRK